MKHMVVRPDHGIWPGHFLHICLLWGVLGCDKMLMVCYICVYKCETALVFSVAKCGTGTYECKT